MVDVMGVFRALHNALLPGGHAFISVPHAASLDQQEDLVHLWDMPPNHVGRWTETAFRIASQNHGLELLAVEVQPLHRLAEIGRLSVYRVNSRAYGINTLAGRVNALTFRPLRMVLKATMAIAEIPFLALHVAELQGHTLWVHLRRQV
jgi:hypothetical protein